MTWPRAASHRSPSPSPFSIVVSGAAMNPSRDIDNGQSRSSGAAYAGAVRGADELASPWDATLRKRTRLGVTDRGCSDRLHGGEV
jgi:hypothetical protein